MKLSSAGIIVLCGTCIVFAGPVKTNLGQEEVSPPRSSVSWESDEHPTSDESDHDREKNAPPVKMVSLLQQPVPEPLQPSAPFLTQPSAPTEAQRLAASIFGAPSSIDRSLLTQTRRRPLPSKWDVVFGDEAKFRATTDTGSLLRKAMSARGVAAQRRGPIITEPQVRGSRVGPLLASGSYWFPARPDLDTLLSRIDSRIVDDVLVVKGPYASRYGPGFDFIDVQLLGSPRTDGGYATFGTTSLEYKTNGEQWYGRQSFWGGSSNWGFRVGYGYGVGVDYRDGSGQDFMSSYRTGMLDLALGFDITPDRHLEFSYLRQDQGDVELASQLFDIDYLTTDGFELTYIAEDHATFDKVGIEGWYNATRVEGDLNSPAKQAQVEFLAATNFRATTDAANRSTGFSAFGDWYGGDGALNTLGLDFRYLVQRINQVGTSDFFPPAGFFGNNATPEINFPLPEAYTANPGVFFERRKDVSRRLALNAGGRLDLVETNAARLVNEANGLIGLSNQVFYNPNGDPVTIIDPGTGAPIQIPGIVADLGDVAGASFNQSFTLGSAYLTGDYKLNDCWTLSPGGAFAMRAPTMIELYAASMTATVLPQTTSSVLVGEPDLKPEKRLQLDCGLRYDNGGRVRGGVNGFYAWVHDYITYDLIVPNFVIYKYTNTDLATLSGFDLYGEFETTNWLTAFALMSYVEGRDHSRRGNGTIAPGFGRLAAQPRSQVPTIEEPLPVIPPLESRLGVRMHRGCERCRNWMLELSARVVDNQDRVALSLAEERSRGFTVWDLRGYCRPSESLLLVAGVENFTDKFYQEHLDPHGRIVPTPITGIPVSTGTVYQPGVNFYFSAEVSY